MVVAWCFVQDGCSHCADLENGVAAAGLTSQVEFSGNNPCGSGSTPATKTAAGCYMYPNCDSNCQLNAIKAAAAKPATPAAKPATPASPATTPKAAPAIATTAAQDAKELAWRTAQWSNSIDINWGERNPKPVIAETPVGWQPPDILLTPVYPLPPVMTTGITIALRDHKKVPKGRKIA